MKSSTILALTVAVLGITAAVVVGSGGQGGTGGKPTDAISLHPDGTQVVTILAKGGYQPRLIKARAGVDTVIQIETRGTFDCSAALVIPTLGVREFLPPTGIRSFPVPAQEPGTTLDGSCSMGMYGFRVMFE
jgi:plastocyanin domain-containing protein